MILDQPNQFYSPWVPEEIHTYADAVRFSEAMFYYFNGKVNPNFPAKGIVFGNMVEHTGVLGKNVVDLVVVYPHNIMRYVQENISIMPTARDVSCLLKGTILYVIIHELLHMEQDFDAYHKKYKNPTPRIELACHIMTKKYLDYLYDSTCYVADIPLEFFETFTPGAENFFNYSKKTIDKYMNKADEIFFTANPIDKSIYFWDLLLENHFKEYSPTGSIRDLVNIDNNNTPIETLIAKFYIDCVIPIKDMYIKYAGKWMSPDIILNIPRTIVLLENNTEVDEEDVVIFSRVGYAKEAPSCACIDISMNTRADNSLFEIAYRLRDGQQPVPRV